VHTEPSSRIALEIKRIASSLFADHTDSLAARPRRRSLRGWFSRQPVPTTLELATNSSK